MKVTVYRFHYFNRELSTVVLSDHWATAEAIRQIGGKPLTDDPLEVEAGKVSTSGLVANPPTEG